ncbi:MAG: hypothetical protein A2015_14205 [Spirochaetes bacterium GWF1_31_7]|nr:MAG: hypothetical protein A2Y30_03545 [Spirochaetes bacterium GWE1_32_154]OHD45259.1 MAG: hypothetical protein A2Y29_02400 [Spirochaetes bacterium GWE2_31_10]OHD50554.1 MAG: hypothetical protein A2015_14205 [Spirochaetes bacterium GWF1_31_7]OHD78574.1 MAG: hypothetical protein A2355_03185 [Spirochaetes bacterium RIFOXYB1_FULL_32_8]HBI36568.1 hypothetical protein [Spirochaetia bacterium]
MQPSEKKNDQVRKQSQTNQVGFYPYVRMIITLILVVGVIYLIYYFLRKKLNDTNNSVTESAVVLSQPIGVGKSVQVIHIAGKYLLIGVTNEAINMLSEITDEKEIERLEILYNDKKVKTGQSFKDIFQSLFSRVGGNALEEKKFDYEEDTIDFIKRQKERINNIKKKDDLN